MIQITSKGNNASCTRTERITSGMVGLRCEFLFDAAWDGLSRTAVFAAGNEQRDVLLSGDVCAVPWEVLQISGYPLTVGVYGTNADGTVVIPTVYVNCGNIDAGADPKGEESAEPTPALVEQLLAAVGEAVSKADAAEEAVRTADFGGGIGERGADGHSPVVTADKKGTVTTIRVDGEAIATINDGRNGADGHTPVRGSDYWTAADRQTIVSDTLAALPRYTGGVE